jgi:hypothetical protein
VPPCARSRKEALKKHSHLLLQHPTATSPPLPLQRYFAQPRQPIAPPCERTPFNSGIKNTQHLSLFEIPRRLHLGFPCRVVFAQLRQPIVPPCERTPSIAASRTHITFLFVQNPTLPSPALSLSSKTLFARPSSRHWLHSLSTRFRGRLRRQALTANSTSHPTIFPSTITANRVTTPSLPPSLSHSLLTSPRITPTSPSIKSKARATRSSNTTSLLLATHGFLRWIKRTTMAMARSGLATLFGLRS